MQNNSRSINLDVYRVIALLLVVVYHAWVVSGSHPFNYVVFNLLIPLGGEIGVTAFFVLSGCTIYKSLEKQQDRFNYKNYMVRRFKRVAPEYYFSLVLVIFFTPQGASYLNPSALKHVLANCTFTQNILPGLGGINGVLWTMSVTMMFYLVAPFLYKLIRSLGIVPISIFAVCLTVFAKYMMIHFLGQTVDNAFWLSRQTIITDLDNFVLGMAAAALINEKKNKWYYGPLALSVVLLLLCCKLGFIYGIHTDNLSGYIWHSLLAIVLCMQLVLVTRVSFLGEKFISVISWIAQKQYGIYVFHLLIIQNIYYNSEGIQLFLENHHVVGIVFLMITSLIISTIVSTIVIYAVRYFTVK